MSGDDVKSIEGRLKSGQLFFVDNPSSSAEIWKDLQLIAQMCNDKEVVLQGWCACKYCHQLFRTHSDVDEKGKRKNYGLSSQQRHVANCSKKPCSSSKQQPRIATFLTSKKKLTASQANRLKIAEVKYVVGGMHSFLSVEHEGLLNLAQTCVALGNETGNVQVNDIWYGRKTVQATTLEEFHKLTLTLKNILSPSISANEVAACTDLWTDDHKKRSYLDFTVFWLDESWSLKHTMLRCKVFEAERKTADNIREEIHTIMAQFDLPTGDTPITTDAGANIVAALNAESRYQCMAHRLSTVLRDAWSYAIKHDKSLCALDEAVRDVSGFIHRSSIMCDDLPLSLKSSCATRPWRSFFDVHNSFYVSYEHLRSILDRSNESHRLLPVSPALLKRVVEFFAPFNAIFDHLEMAETPTLQNVIPSYYLLQNSLSDNSETDLPAIQLLKQQVLSGLDNKYWSSTTAMHQLATILDPTFRNLTFIHDDVFRRKVVQDARVAAKMMAQYLKNSSDSDINPPPSKQPKTDIFSTLRAPSLYVAKSTNLSLQDAVAVEYDGYMALLIVDAPTNPLHFWRSRIVEFPLLGQLARKVFVIQASSGESERHFSSGGAIVNSKRSRLDADTVESLVVLKEASLNGLW